MFTLLALCRNFNCITFYTIFFDFVIVGYSVLNDGNEIRVKDLQQKNSIKYSIGIICQYPRDISTRTNTETYTETQRLFLHVPFA